MKYYTYEHLGKAVIFKGPGVDLTLNAFGLPKRECDRIVAALHAAYRKGTTEFRPGEFDQVNDVG